MNSIKDNNNSESLSGKKIIKSNFQQKFLKTKKKLNLNCEKNFFFL